MTDYYCLRFSTDPVSEDAYDLLASYLVDIGFESFVNDGDDRLAYIAAETYDRKAVEEIVKSFPMEVTISFSEEFIEGRDWNEEWEKNYFQPIKIGDRCIVHSSFHKDYEECEYEIIIDPRMAFGTGHHATTSMMLSYLLEEDLEGKVVTDMGAGTGILSILSKMRGAKKVTGIEIDPYACENANDNIKLNRVELEIVNGDASSLEKVETADIFLANINRNVILADMELYQDKLSSGGKMILSGFFISDVPLIEEVAREFGMKIAKTKTEGDWAAVMLKKR